MRRREWTHKGVHSDFVQLFVRRRKLVPASFAGALPPVMHLRHIADYHQPGVSHVQAERAVRRAREFGTLLQREVSMARKQTTASQRQLLERTLSQLATWIAEDVERLELTVKERCNEILLDTGLFIVSAVSN